MLDVKVILNSNIEEVLAFKCCSVLDQNMEMHVRNLSARPLVISGRCILENENGVLELNLFPPWEQVISPGKTTAFYCCMDPLVWERYETLTVFDREGGTHSFHTREITDYALDSSQL